MLPDDQICDPFEDLDPGHSQPGDTMMPKADLAKTTKTPASQRPRLSAFLEQGEFTSLEDLEGQEVLIHSLESIETKFGPAMKAGITDEAGDAHVCCLGQTLLYPAACAIAEAIGVGALEFPVAARFVKSGRTWICE